MNDIDPTRIRFHRTISRRRLIQGAAASAATLGALGSLSSVAASVVRTSTGKTVAQAPSTCLPFGAFDSHTFDTLSAIAAQIIPNNDGSPGAADICLVNFIEVSASGNSDLQKILTNGVAAVDQSSQTLFGANFVALSYANQTTVLQQLEAGTAPGSLWNSADNRNSFTNSSGQTPAALQSVMSVLSGPVGPIATQSPNFSGDSFQQVFFGTCRSLTKTAWVINWPEAFVRDPSTGQPFFSDAAHLISDPDVPGTGTCWDVIRYNVIDYQTEVLMWAWQAGLKVTGFSQGWPTFDSKPLKDKDRLAARDQLYALSNQGLA